MIYKGAIGTELEWTAWLTLENPDKTLDEAIEDLQARAIEETGKPVEILEIDRVNNRIKTLHVKEKN